MFESIKAHNLFSWENLDYEIKKGISQISGFNYDDNTSEGSGKSSVPNTLCWVLYGRIPKDAKIDEVVREGADGGSGSVRLVSGHGVTRSRKPNDVFIIAPDGKVSRGKDAKETQTMINKLIGLDFDSFCQTIYFAQNYPNKFIASNETDKAKILSEVQDLTVFDKGRKRAQEMIKAGEILKGELEKQLTAQKAECTRLESNAELMVKQIDRFNSEKEDKRKILEERILGFEEDVARLEKIVNTPTSYKAALANLETLYNQLSDKKVELLTSIRMADTVTAEKRRLTETSAKLDSQIEKAIKKSSSLKSAEPGNCPTCGQAASQTILKRHAQHLEEQKAELAQEIEVLTKEANEVTEKLKEVADAPSVEQNKAELKELEAEIQKLGKDRTKLQNGMMEQKKAEVTYQSFKRNLEDMRAAYRSVDASDCEKDIEELEKLSAKLNIITEDCATLEKKFNKKVQEINDLEILKTGFKEVKQYVFQSLLQQLSTKATSIASELFEVPISIQFSNEDEDGAISKILTSVTLDGKERSLGLYSGGQYRRIELSVDLALASIVGARSAKPINFRVLDEPFKDLSESSMEKMVKLLEKLKGSTIIIEHNSITRSIIHNEFHVEYRNGVSRAA